MDKNNEQKNNKTPEMKPKQDSFRPWLKLIPAAAVFAAVCVTCYQAVPFLIPLIVPLDDTVAIFLLPDLYVTFPDGAAFAVILVVLPTFTDADVKVTCKVTVKNQIGRASCRERV